MQSAASEALRGGLPHDFVCTPVSVPPVTPSQTSSLRVSEELREAILSGEFGPGERLRTESLAKRFGSSRTPVREALVQLEGEGLVVVEPRRGALVRPFASDDLVDLYEVRALLEPPAAARAARHVTPEQLERLRALVALSDARGGEAPDAIDDQIAWNEEFHGIVIDAARSPRLAAALRATAGIPRAFRTAFWRDAEHRAFSLTCHRELVSALADGAADRAEGTMRIHILRARDLVAGAG
jgi:DNA-binding GntR family transcriptional regulator